MSVESVWTCGDYARALFISRSRLRVQRASGIPCALYLLEGQINAQLGRIAPREGGHVPARTAVRFHAIVCTWRVAGTSSRPCWSLHYLG